MKHLKTKLMASVAMLMVATVMISSASFAWFTISTAPEVSGIDTGLAANGNLEIALSTTANFSTPASTYTSGTDYDAGKNATWGNLIDLSAAADAVTLKPVAFDATTGAFKAPTFGKDGRISGFTDLTGYYKALSEDTGNFTDGGIVVYKKSEDATDIYAFRVDYFMRTNTAGSVKLLETGANRGAGEDGLGTTIETDGEAGAPIKVYFKVDNAAPVCFYDGSAESPAWDFDTALFEATDGDSGTINDIHNVSMFVVWDGAAMDNSDFTNLVQDLKLNVQFTHSATLTDIGIEGTDYARPTTE